MAHTLAKKHTLIIITVILAIAVAYLSVKTIKLKRQKSEVEEKILKWRKMALTDDLTRLKNRLAFNLKIDTLKKIKENNTIGILLFDVDNFKLINDVEGHLAGDKKLREVAIALLDVFDLPKCSVYRFGGDEFAVITQNISEDEIINLLLKIREYERNKKSFSLSKGYSIVSSAYCKDLEKAIDRADEMLYADKLLKHKNLQKSEKIS